MIRIVFRFIAIGLGMLHAYAAIQSQSMNADGIAYLDIGDAYFRGDWANAINAVWSPLYSWILGFVNFLIRPSMQWEFALVHLVNYLIFLFALLSFEFMWQNARKADGQPDSLTLSDSLWWALGYLLFIWTSLSLIQIWSVTPDMLMAAFVFLAAGTVARIRAGDRTVYTFIVLGLILGLGYLSKAFMFYISLIFIGLAWFLQKRGQASTYRTLLSAGMFLIVSLPFILLISQKQGRLTLSEAGRVTYLRHVIGVPYPHWQGDPLRNIMPDHPSRLVHSSPPVYEFGKSIGGTYLPSTDPAYGYEGIDVQIGLSQLWIPLLVNSLAYVDLFLQKQGVIVASVIALYAMMQRKRSGISEALCHWALAIPAVVAFGLYGLVLVANRYVGAFILLFWTDVLANIQLPDVSNNRLWVKTLSGIAIVGLLANIVMFNLDGIRRLTPSTGFESGGQLAPPARPLIVAEHLEKLGIQPGDKVGVIGYGYDSFWARLARVRIVAEMPEDNADIFWRGDKALEQSVLQAFAGTDVRAVIAEDVPEFSQMYGWHKIQDSNYYIYVFHEQ